MAISGGSFGFGYDALSRRTSLTRPNAVSTTYGYDNLSRLLSVVHAKGSSTIDGATYTVDNAGNRTSKTDQRTAVTTNYGYDNIYQLLSATPSSGSPESYTYDPLGNRLSSAGVPSYSYNSSNELTSNSSATYGYDLNGNAVTKNDSTGITTYGWDFENRLTSVTLPGSGGTVTFAYDPFGRRIKKVSGTGTSIFAFDGDNLIEEVNASGGAVARYSQGLNIDEPLAMLRSSVTSFYNADGLGSITSLANTSGSLAQSYTFDSFGKQIASSGSLTNPFQYTGRESDSETGLYYYRARYYDPNAGRFLSEDPLGFLGGDVNFYTYVQNDSTSLTDPDGLTPQDCTHTCVGRARVLKGNPRKVGKQGGVPGRLVAPDSAAASPKQFGFPSGAGFANLPVSGTTGAPLDGALPGLLFPDVSSGASSPQQSFNGITDVNGGRSPIAGMNVRDALAKLNPRSLLLELVTGKDQGVTTVILTLPKGQPCPTGTVDSNLLKIHTNPFGL